MKNYFNRMIINIVKFILHTLNFIYFLLGLLWQNSYKNNITKKQKGVVSILANGPSLNQELLGIGNEKEFRNVDFIVVNFFAFDNIFIQIKPKHYCLADPMFFQDSHKIANVRKLYDILEKQINWDLNIYIPSSRYHDFLSYSNLKNKHLKIVRMNILDYTGYEVFRHFFYKKGLSMPYVKNVTNLAIYVAINCGYSEIRLYGVDHTFFDSLCINEKNQLCNRDTHFYDKGETELKPLTRNDNDKIWKISDYLEAIMLMFRSHDLLENYAKHLNVKIFNYTKCSMIDSYERKK